jgi:hypothetical protein
MRDIGATSVADLRHKWPAWAATVDEFEHEFAGRGIPLRPERWVELSTSPAKKAQARIAASRRKVELAALRSKLSIDEAALFLDGSGTGAGAFLDTDAQGEPHMDDDHYICAVRRRLLVKNPAGTAIACTRRGAAGELCGAAVRDDYGLHGSICPKGGTPTQCHDALVRDLGRWVQDVQGVPVQYEQDVPHWARGDERARLDLVFRAKGGALTYVDLAVVEPLSTNVDVTRRRARVAGAAVKAQEQGKHLRYPGSGLDVFALGAGGRWGAEAAQFVRGMSAHLDREERSHAVRRIRHVLSTRLQWWKAHQLLTATAGACRPWPSPVRSVH